jgi:hypothetical protein
VVACLVAESLVVRRLKWSLGVLKPSSSFVGFVSFQFVFLLSY